MQLKMDSETLYWLAIDLQNTIEDRRDSGESVSVEQAAEDFFNDRELPSDQWPAVLELAATVRWNACVDCGSTDDYYVVADSVWRAAGLAEANYCCLVCLQRRLERELRIEDFTLCQANRLALVAAGQLQLLLQVEAVNKEIARLSWKSPSKARKLEARLRLYLASFFPAQQTYFY